MEPSETFAISPLTQGSSKLHPNLGMSTGHPPTSDDTLSPRPNARRRPHGAGKEVAIGASLLVSCIALRSDDRSCLKDLKLMCYGLAILTLHGLGMVVSRLISSRHRNSRFNRKGSGPATDERARTTVTGQASGWARAPPLASGDRSW